MHEYETQAAGRGPRLRVEPEAGREIGRDANRDDSCCFDGGRSNSQAPPSSELTAASLVIVSDEQDETRKGR